jgi:hypothetical protein
MWQVLGWIVIGIILTVLVLCALVGIVALQFISDILKQVGIK